MFTHQNIWFALDRLANACGYSTSGLARKAGLDPTSFNQKQTGGPDGKPRWPSTESISGVLEATGSPLSDFISLLEKTKIFNLHILKSHFLDMHKRTRMVFWCRWLSSRRRLGIHPFSLPQQFGTRRSESLRPWSKRRFCYPPLSCRRPSRIAPSTTGSVAETASLSKQQKGSHGQRITAPDCQ